MLLRLGRDLRMPFLLGKNGAIPFAPVNTYIENALEHFPYYCGPENESKCHFYWRKMAFAFVA